MRVRIFIIMISIVCSVSSIQADIFTSLFGHKDKQKSDVQIQEEPASKEGTIVEEEVISADEYMDSTDEPDEDQLFDQANQKDTFSQDSAIDEAPEVEKAISTDEYDTQEDDLEEDSSLDDPFIKVKNILLSYSDKPDKIYLLQHFPIHLKAIIPQTNIKAIQTDFIGGKDYKVINPDRPWEKTGENSYENTFYLKLLTKQAKLPNIKVSKQSQSGKVQSEVLKAFNSKIVSLRQDNLFCKILANSLDVHKHQERKYDEQSNIIVLELNATNGNLEDFHIPFASREGIDDIKTKGLNQKIYYFCIVSNSKKIFKFKYFNLLRNRFEIISFDIKPIDTTISTHTNLNPQKNKYIIYKMIALGILALLFLILYFKTKKIYYIALALVTIVFLFYTQVPIRKVTIRANVPLRILPMQNSTIFFRTNKPLNADILLKKERYTKVLLPNKKIGWIKNEDLR